MASRAASLSTGQATARASEQDKSAASWQSLAHQSQTTNEGGAKGGKAADEMIDCGLTSAADTSLSLGLFFVSSDCLRNGRFLLREYPLGPRLASAGATAEQRAAQLSCRASDGRRFASPSGKVHLARGLGSSRAIEWLSRAD